MSGLWIFERARASGRDVRTRRIVRAGEAALIVAALAFLSVLDGPGSLPGVRHYHCPFNSLTGLDCPGCGMTRAMFALMHGRFREAAALNPGAFVVAGFLLYRLFQRAMEMIFGWWPAVRGSNMLFLFAPLLLLVLGLARLAVEIAGLF